MITKAISAVEPANLNSNSEQSHYYGNLFHEIFRRIQQKSSIPQAFKAEIKGLLVPCYKALNGRISRFKIDINSGEVFLFMNYSQEIFAKKIVWEYVCAKGVYDPVKNALDLERLAIQNQNNESTPVLSLDDVYFDTYFYRKKVEQGGKIEPDIEEIAS